MRLKMLLSKVLLAVHKVVLFFVYSIVWSLFCLISALFCAVIPFVLCNLVLDLAVGGGIAFSYYYLMSLALTTIFVIFVWVRAYYRAHKSIHKEGGKK